MKVLYLTMNPNRASTTVPTEGWFKVLRKRGLQPILVSHTIGDFHDWTVEQGIPAYHIPLPFPSKLRPWKFLRSLWRLRRLVHHHKIQLIHCNEQNIYPIGRYLSRLCRLPVVVSVHFTMDRGFCQWAFGGNQQPDRMFFTSRANCSNCRPGIEDVVPESRWRLLLNGMDLRHLCADEKLRDSFRSEHSLGNTFLIGTASALRPRKQLEHLFEAASRIASPDFRVVIAGAAVSGDEEYSAKLLKDARSLLGNKLVYLGHLKDLRSLFNALDVYVNTSKEEACSLSILESLACGCPVVGYPSKSVDEQVEPGGGEIVPQDDIGALSAALSRWLSDSERLAAARLGARKRVEDHYDIEKLAGQLWDEYQCVLQERGKHVGRDVA
jgi:glycosyltransferase involved in cell wall biosynthesis